MRKISSCGKKISKKIPDTVPVLEVICITRKKNDVGVIVESEERIANNARKIYKYVKYSHFTSLSSVA